MARNNNLGNRNTNIDRLCSKIDGLVTILEQSAMAQAQYFSTQNNGAVDYGRVDENGIDSATPNSLGTLIQKIDKLIDVLDDNYASASNDSNSTGYRASIRYRDSDSEEERERKRNEKIRNEYMRLRSEDSITHSKRRNEEDDDARYKINDVAQAYGSVPFFGGVLKNAAGNYDKVYSTLHLLKNFNKTFKPIDRQGLMNKAQERVQSNESGVTNITNGANEAAESLTNAASGASDAGSALTGVAGASGAAEGGLSSAGGAALTSAGSLGSLSAAAGVAAAALAGLQVGSMVGSAAGEAVASVTGGDANKLTFDLKGIEMQFQKSYEDKERENALKKAQKKKDLDDISADVANRNSKRVNNASAQASAIVGGAQKESIRITTAASEKAMKMVNEAKISTAQTKMTETVKASLITDGINAAAYSAAEKMIDFEKMGAELGADLTALQTKNSATIGATDVSVGATVSNAFNVAAMNNRLADITMKEQKLTNATLLRGITSVNRAEQILANESYRMNEATMERDARVWKYDNVWQYFMSGMFGDYEPTRNRNPYTGQEYTSYGEKAEESPWGGGTNGGLLASMMTGAGGGAITGGAIGGTIGTVVPVVGNISVGTLGAFIGSILGAGVGGYQYLKREGRAQVEKDYAEQMLNIQKDVHIAKTGLQTANFNADMANMERGYQQNWAISTAATDAQVSSIIGGASASATSMKANAGAHAESMIADATNQVVKMWADTTAEVRKAWLKAAQKTEEMLEKFDRPANNTGLSLGMTNPWSMYSYKRSMLNMNSSVFAKFAKTPEDALQFQNSYIEETGRNKTFSKHDYGQLFGLGTYLGDDKLAQEFAAQMEIFNKSANGSVDMIDKVLQSANRMGLNGRKLTKDIVNNLKMAQKYTFKDGVKGMMEMSKWAQNTRFNMESLPAMIDGLKEGGLEGIITKSAEFQVLGGQSAIQSDPLGLMYDAYADPASLAKRYQTMTSGFGRFNAESGGVDFNINESMMIDQLAKLQGRSSEELRNEITQRVKDDSIKSQMSSEQLSMFSDEQIAAISNKASYENGQWQVTMSDGQNIAVDDLTREDLVDLIPLEHDEKMEEYMTQVLNYIDALITAVELQAKAEVMKNTYDSWIKEIANRGAKTISEIQSSLNEYVAKVMNGMDTATQAYSSILTQTSDEVKNEAEGMNKAAKDMTSAANKMETSANRIKEGATATVNAASELTKKATEAAGEVKNALNAVTNNQVDNAYSHRLAQALDYAFSHITANGFVELPNNSTATMRSHFFQMSDDIVSGNGNRMMVGASRVTPINDGEIALTSHKDYGLFAQDGGPFDKLLDDVFGRVDDVYNAVISSSNTSNVEAVIPLGSDIVLPLERKMDDLASAISKSNNSGNNNQTMSFQPLNVNINGRLELTSGGQNVDIMTVLNENPSLRHELVRMIINEMNNNGGKNPLIQNVFSYQA